RLKRKRKKTKKNKENILLITMSWLLNLFVVVIVTICGKISPFFSNLCNSDFNRTPQEANATTSMNPNVFIIEVQLSTWVPRMSLKK
ncbi:MAG TPA: hypothetical protein PLE29_11110, partial [Saprospiraceae bacterium]|nr:hypothetical protein [Saprospiraceae bacterium]